ncbi:MAG: sulfotransferase [Thermoplasmatales archaeon]|nr:sulfotransferase [Thermoplasmatales archaeon]
MKLDDKYLSKIQDISFQPVFILGLPRSGTSILYKILAKTQCFNYVSVYHIMNYDNLLFNHIFDKEDILKNEINKIFEENKIIDRGIDALQPNADFPEEYDFILFNKSSKFQINSKNISLVYEFSKKIQFISENNNPLLLKNLWDFSNFIFIKKAIPNSKFIFIHRHPFKTLSSQIKSQIILFEKKPFYHSLLITYYEQVYQYPLFVLMMRFFYTKLSPLMLIYLTYYYTQCHKYFLKNVKQLSANEYINIKYEELCENTSENIQKILDFLNLKSNTQIDYKKYIKTRDMPLDKSVNKMKKMIYKTMKNYFDYFDYKYY